MNLFRRRKPIKAIFGTKIDFRDNKEFGELEKGGSYHIPRRSNQEKQTSYDEIKSFATNLIEDELKKHLAKTVGLQIQDIRVTADYEGSIELVFVVLFSTFQFVAGIKDFYDSLRLIRNHAAKYLNRRLEEKYGPVFNVDANIEYPTIDRYEELFMLFGHHDLPFPFHSHEHSKRDGLFFYLLISNIILLTIIGFLIFKAVKSYYGF